MLLVFGKISNHICMYIYCNGIVKRYISLGLLPLLFLNWYKSKHMSIKRIEYQKDTYINSELFFQGRMIWTIDNTIFSINGCKKTLCLHSEELIDCRKGRARKGGRERENEAEKERFASYKNPLKMGNRLLKQKKIWQRCKKTYRKNLTIQYN